MQTQYAIPLAVVIGVGLGVAGVSLIHAQVKAPPPAYVIAEIDVSNQEGYVKEYLPPSSKALLDNGARYLARGSKTVSIKGEPPKRIVVLSFDSLEKGRPRLRHRPSSTLRRSANSMRSSESMRWRECRSEEFITPKCYA